MGHSPFHGIFSALAGDHPLKHQDIPPPQNSREPQAMPFGASAGQQVGQIAVDIYEQDHYYIIRAPIAGVRLADLDIEVDERTLTIRGTRRLHDDVPDQAYYLRECFFGDFARSITLPCVIDPKRVKATFSKDGILKILVPKEEKVKIIRINEV